MISNLGRTANEAYVKGATSLAKGHASKTIEKQAHISSSSDSLSLSSKGKTSLWKHKTIKRNTPQPIQQEVKKLLKNDIDKKHDYKSPGEIAKVVVDPQNKETVNTGYFQSKLNMIKNSWNVKKQQDYTFALSAEKLASKSKAHDIKVSTPVNTNSSNVKDDTKLVDTSKKSETKPDAKEIQKNMDKATELYNGNVHHKAKQDFAKYYSTAKDNTLSPKNRLSNFMAATGELSKLEPKYTMYCIENLSDMIKILDNTSPSHKSSYKEYLETSFKNIFNYIAKFKPKSSLEKYILTNMNKQIQSSYQSFKISTGKDDGIYIAQVRPKGVQQIERNYFSSQSLGLPTILEE